jgi:hypothetical protein
MARWRLARMAAALALGAALGTACEGPPGEPLAEAVQDRLVGTWLREYREEAVTVRRVLVLERAGSFQERTIVRRAGLPPVAHAHQGEWLFDGTNLKRRYTLVDGRLPAAPMVPFATLQLEFPSRREFIGVDNVRRRAVRYERVPEGTEP